MYTSNTHRYSFGWYFVYTRATQKQKTSTWVFSVKAESAQRAKPKYSFYWYFVYTLAPKMSLYGHYRVLFMLLYTAYRSERRASQKQKTSTWVFRKSQKMLSGPSLNIVISLILVIQPYFSFMCACDLMPVRSLYCIARLNIDTRRNQISRLVDGGPLLV